MQNPQRTCFLGYDAALLTLLLRGVAVVVSKTAAVDEGLALPRLCVVVPGRNGTSAGTHDMWQVAGF